MAFSGLSKVDSNRFSSISQSIWGKMHDYRLADEIII
jgi:hypothetical protein